MWPGSREPPRSRITFAGTFPDSTPPSNLCHLRAQHAHSGHLTVASPRAASPSPASRSPGIPSSAIQYTVSLSDDLHNELEKLLAKSRKQRVAALDLAAEIDRVRRLIAQDQEARSARLTPEPAPPSAADPTTPPADPARTRSADPDAVDVLLAHADATERLVSPSLNPPAAAEVTEIPSGPQSLVSRPVDLGNLAPLIAPSPSPDETERE